MRAIFFNLFMKKGLAEKYGYEIPPKAIARNNGKEVDLKGCVAQCICKRVVGAGTTDEEDTLRRCFDTRDMGLLYILTRIKLTRLFGGHGRIAVVTGINKEGIEDEFDPTVEYSAKLSAKGCPSGEKRPPHPVYNTLRNILELPHSIGEEIARILLEIMRTNT